MPAPAPAAPAATGLRPRPAGVRPVPGARDPKLAERVAASIEAEVIRAGWPVGTALGSEDQLADRYGVGRAVIREAIRLTEHRQVTRMRRGRGGGLVVAEPDASAVTESLAIYLEYARAPADDLLEARTVLEDFAAAAAAESLDEAHLHALRAAAAQDGGPAAGGRVHSLIAEATGNAALSLFIQAIAPLTSQPAAAPGAAGPACSAARHAAVVEAICAGDALQARARMHEHMTALRAAAPSSPAAAIAGAARGTGVPGPAARPGNAVAARIRQEIVRRGWPVGESLGFEGDLLREYGVGRAQFREAIRILENHSVVRMQRGAAGGMVVAVPDGQALTRAVSLYLTYRGMNAAHIRDLREELEAAALRLAIERLDPAGEERLAATLGRESTWPDDDFRAVSHDLHAVIAELSGNQTLTLLVSIVMQLTAERLHSHSVVGPQRATDPPDATRHAHRAIVAAIVARDQALALRRLRKHLRALARWTVEAAGAH